MNIDLALEAAGWIIQGRAEMNLAQEIADDLRSALGQIEDVIGDLESRAAQ